MRPDLDEARLCDALQLAEQAIGLSDPNPRVGCVIGLQSGEVLGQGFTQAAGQAHAEVMALRDAATRGCSVRGATVWVSLEPCAHQGRTPPCTDALIAAQVGRVVIAMTDPHPSVSGRGIEQLRAAGIEVCLGSPAIQRRALELNIGFHSRMTRGRPWVRMKAALSLDGRSALNNGTSQWITGELARKDGHAWRKRAAAVLTGVGTVLHDNPRLDVRLVPSHRQPLRVVLDSNWRTPPTAQVLQPPGHALVIGLDTPAFLRRQQALREVSETLCVDNTDGLPAATKGVVLAHVLQELHRREVNEVHVEAGPRLNGSLLTQSWVDEMLLYVAPFLLGPGQPFASLAELHSLPSAQEWGFVGTDTLGCDIRLLLRRQAPTCDTACR